MKTLHAIDGSLEKTISEFYQSNILSVMKNLNQLCQRTNIVKEYKIIITKLSLHFNILTQEKIEEQTRKVDVNDDKQLDSFLQKVIVRIHHNISKIFRVNF